MNANIWIKLNNLYLNFVIKINIKAKNIFIDAMNVPVFIDDISVSVSENALMLAVPTLAKTVKLAPRQKDK